MSLSDKAYHAVRDEILRGQLRPGTPLSRRRLARQLGMSVLPVTDALRRLEGDGLVESRARAGTRVRVPSEKDVRELYELRELLEPAAAALATVRADAAERRAVQRLARLTDRPSGGFAPNRDFHHALCAPCGNGLVMRTLDSVWTHRAAEGLFAYQTLPPGAVERLAEEHGAIAGAFAEGDAARVRALVHDHVRAAGSDALERLPGHQDNEAEEIS